ncbi:hypothetical protein D7W79_11055 [Corallococcus exercitus]|uniref:ABC transporter permease n=1 Tax=Corallococcus exercitus TaxID=2316736 RepID=A0A3A8IH87_9BACT|nr:hypothetical protein [Corallococcus exercitus]NOK34301.1 hypothetical protein [Corallococcus exercitus]RKG79140.1 hypothetical protein D7W79_11055 [Corallococcus exercitus]
MRDLSGHRKSLGFFYLFVHALMLLATGAMAYLTAALGFVAAAGRSAPRLPAWENPWVLAMAAIFVVLLAASIAGLALGLGLVRGRRVSKGLATLLALVALPTFPLGTALGVYSLWFFSQEGWDAEPWSP